MGRPNAETKRAKGRRQRAMQHKYKCFNQVNASSNDLTFSNSVTDNTKVQFNHCTSPLLFSGPPSFNSTTTTTHATSNPDSPALTPFSAGSEPSHRMQDVHDTDLHANIARTVEIGDTDIIEMELYDSFRKEDAEKPSNAYLLKCRDKLRRKYQCTNKEICRF